MEDNKDKGIVWVPYTIKTVSTSINGETVWYANKWKNLLLKIKHFFIKPKYLKNTHIYKNKPVNPSFYRKIKIFWKYTVKCQFYQLLRNYIIIMVKVIIP